jgi:hypothetical protein
MSSEPRDADEEEAIPEERAPVEDCIREVAPRTVRVEELGAAKALELTVDSPPPPAPDDPLDPAPDALNAELEDEDLPPDEDEPDEEEPPRSLLPPPPEDPPDDPRLLPLIPRMPSPVNPPKLRLPRMAGAIKET